jgi:hypothetical protein
VAAWFWQDVRDDAIAVLPEWAREKYGYGAPPPLAPGPGGDPPVAERP